VSTYAAEDFDAIRRRVEELKAERDLALTGSSAPSQSESKVGEYATGWPYTAAGED
jgi:hypothetical protein